eukprot:TRINITY_DN67094_c10_g1_i2.p1 TRINITY_DN67094_c10_g1~~TRINITY_DN67094_c10_g1_i2.p1  ORF type:complete len:652 (+),score=141.45 TRINITY_DN67094_c10_g1_i2:67-2022(+)
MEREGEGEPQTAEERIKRRKERLNARMEARKLGTDEGKLQNQENERPLGKGEQQIQESRKKLDYLKTIGTEQVTKFRIETDIAENERRIDEEASKENRIQKKTDEAASSAKRNASIQMRWQALYEKNIPQDLLKEINAQKEACEKIINSKNKLVNEFQEELRQKDEEYVKALKKQTEDIDELIKTMHQQTKTLIAAYEEELEEIETAFLQERTELNDKNKAEITALIELRRVKETQNRDARREKIEEEQQKLDHIHENYAEQYNILKMRLQREIQGLEQQLEEMRALYQLNAEKLDYNLRVLGERVKENEKAIQQHKRKLAKLQDVLSGLITKYGDTDKKFQHENNIITEQYRRITEQYKDLQLKYQYFEKADTEKYHQVWEMNETEAMQLVEKCVKADRIVFEQQLGVEWKPPNVNFWGDAQRELEKDEQMEEDQEEEEQQELSEMAKRMLDMLAQQCSFLVEERVRKAIEKLQADLQTPRKIESILKSLSIESQADINKMLHFFTRTIEMEDNDTTLGLISPQDAITALKAFIEHQNKTASLQSSKKNQMLSMEARIKDRKRQQERDFWSRMAGVIPEDNVHIWDALEKGLEKYIVLLQDRGRLIDETDAIRHQNDELRALLNQYMSSPIAEELFSPPQLTIQQNPGEA